MISSFVKNIWLNRKTHDNYQFQLSIIDLLNHIQLILCMIIFDGRTYLIFHITIPKIDDIDKVNFFKYNCQSLNSIGEKIYSGNDRLFYLNNEGKLDIYYTYKGYYIVENNLLFSLNSMHQNCNFRLCNF